MIRKLFPDVEYYSKYNYPQTEPIQCRKNIYIYIDYNTNEYSNTFISIFFNGIKRKLCNVKTNSLFTCQLNGEE